LDWWALVREALDVSRRGRTLWALALVSLVQSAFLTVLVGSLLIPLSLSTASIALPGLGARDSTSPLWVSLSQLLGWIADHRGLAVAFVVALFCVWVVTGVLDVAATSGSIAQTARIAERQSASFSAGMKAGFGAWWRVVGVLAIAAIPTLVAALVAAFTMFSLVTLPLWEGLSPDPFQLYIGTMVQSVVNVVAGLVAIPLGVLAGLGMRTIVLEGVGWKAGWRDAVRLARSHLLDVVIVVVILAASNLAFELAVMLAIALVAFVFAAVMLAVPIVGMGVASVAGIAIALIAALAFLAASVWQSVVWTLFWRRARTGEHAPGSPAAGADTGFVEASLRDAR